MQLCSIKVLCWLGHWLSHTNCRSSRTSSRPGFMRPRLWTVSLQEHVPDKTRPGRTVCVMSTNIHTQTRGRTVCGTQSRCLFGSQYSFMPTNLSTDVLNKLHTNYCCSVQRMSVCRTSRLVSRSDSELWAEGGFSALDSRASAERRAARLGARRLLSPRSCCRLLAGRCSDPARTLVSTVNANRGEDVMFPAFTAASGWLSATLVRVRCPTSSFNPKLPNKFHFIFILWLHSRNLTTVWNIEVGGFIACYLYTGLPPGIKRIISIELKLRTTHYLKQEGQCNQQCTWIKSTLR